MTKIWLPYSAFTMQCQFTLEILQWNYEQIIGQVKIKVNKMYCKARHFHCPNIYLYGSSCYTQKLFYTTLDLQNKYLSTKLMGHT